MGFALIVYLQLGFEHVVPFGVDHLLFILCLFFMGTELKQVIAQASVFAVAHSVTLGLTMYGVIHPVDAIVAPLIALSIVLLALENVFIKRLRAWQLGIVFLFGLVHGMGFAGALREFGLPPGMFGTALLGFNLGVELGQIAVILLMYFAVSRTLAEFRWYRQWVVVPCSVLICAAASYMLWNRLVG